jgi:hypothetical protein
MRAFLVGFLFGVGVTVGGAFALDFKSADATKKVVNWGMIGQKAGELSPTKLLRN